MIIVDPDGVSRVETIEFTPMDLIGITIGTPVTDAFNAARAGVKWLIDDWNRA